MKRNIAFLIAVMISTLIWAVPAKREIIKHTQPDGTVLSLMLVGDENLHYYQNVETNEKMQKCADGSFRTLSATEFSAMASSAKARMAQNKVRRQARMAARKVGTVGSMTGQKKGIVILVNFADEAFDSSHTLTTFDDMFNKVGYSTDGHIGSVADYFKDQSYGQFELSFDVVGPITLANNMSYYGANDSNDNDKNPGAMVKEACNAVNSQVNFADYDWDGDGYVDQVFIIYAGYGENYGADENTIWPHEWDLVSALGSSLKLDNVYINTYACTAELCETSGTTLNGIGTACHEFSHCLGYPDFYDTDYTGGVGMDAYDVMCSGSYNGPNSRGEVPAGYTAYERWTAGWLEPVELTKAANIDDMADLGSTGSAYIIYNNGNKNEYFLLENRQSKNWFKYYNNWTAGHGLFITHVDYNATAWENNTPNDVASHQRMTWVPADKNYSCSSSTVTSSSQQKGDYFPGTSSVTSFTPSSWSTKGGKWFTKDENGTYYSDHYLTDITESNGKISFKVDGGDNGDRYVVTYNAGPGSCETASWTQTESSGESTTLPLATINSDVWSFAGWSEESVSETTTKPTILGSGKTYTPTADVTLYAVYVKTDEGGEGKAWKKVALSSDLEEGEYALITSTGKAFNGTISSGHGQSTSNAFEFDENDEAESAPDGTCIITIKGSGEGYVMYNEEKGYLFAKAASSGNLQWHATEDSYWVYQNSNLVYNACSAYLRTYSSTFRTYAKALNGELGLVQRVNSQIKTYNSNPDLTLRGDANGNGTRELADVMYVVNYLLGTPADDFKEVGADATQNGTIEMADVMYIIQYLLNNKFPSDSDE